MLIQKKKRYLFSVFVFLFLCLATVAGFYLLKTNQDTRQQASGGCPITNPYCDGLTPVPTTDPGSLLNDKGVVSTTYSGNRPTTQGGCGGVWMNEFCYMPGDELAGGKIIIASGRYDYPYIEDKKVYESVNFGAESVSKVVGSTESLGKDCNGQGVAIGSTCYAYGATVNGYLVVPPRTTGCSNTAGDYCYAHLEKIEVSFTDWQAAVDAYEKTGDTKSLEDLYQQTYGVSFTAGSLYDPNAANADLLKAQAIMSAITNASILQQQAAEQNAALTAKGNLTANEQALFDFNQQIIADKNLATRYQVLDQLNDSNAQQTVMDAAVKQMYSNLVVAGSDADLTKIATDQFKEIFGYDPGTKFGNVNGILEAFGINPAQLNADRSNYATSVAQQTEGFDNLNEEYQKYVSGGGNDIDDLKNAALDAGVVTAAELNNLSEAEILALLLSKFSDTTPEQASQQADAIVSAREASAKEQSLTNQYLDNQGTPDAYGDLVGLYTLYTGHAPRGQFTEVWLQEEVAKYNSQIALSLYAGTQDISYLQDFYKNSTDAYNGTFVPTDEQALLNGIYGEEIGASLYADIVLPNRFNAAVANFAIDGGNDLTAVCKELNVANCNINETNATQTISIMLDQMYGDKPNVNIPDMAVSYSNQIYANSQEQETQSFWDMAFANYAAAQTYDSAGFAMLADPDGIVAQNVANTMEYQTETMAAYSTAVDASEIFNASQTFAYATENRNDLNDYTWGMSYGNALMADNIFDREFTAEEMGLNFGQTANLTFNQLSSQIANVDVAQNIATNYATSKYYDYTGPADTGISNVALIAANNLDVLDYDYQAAESGYYVDKTVSAWGEDIGAFMTEAGAMMAASQMNEAMVNQAMFSGADDFELIDPIEYADQANEEFRADYHQNMMDDLYTNYIANATKAGIDEVQQATFEQFFSDPEVQRSSQELNFERLEKVVAPAAAVVILPAMIASGVGIPVLLGAASSSFSLYQGAGMKAQALEIQRIDIDSRENAVVQSYIDNGADAATVDKVRTDLEAQAAALNQQGNMMLANSAVAAFTSAGGWATSLAGAANAAGTANALATTGQVLTKVGQVGGIGLNSYNAVNSGISSYNSFQEGNYMAGGFSALSSFVAASGVAGNTFGLLGPTAITNKVDLALDIMNVPAGAAVDLQQVSQACYGSSGAFSEKDCNNAWIGLALSAGQNVSQISSSIKNYKGDVVAGQTADLQKQVDAIDLEILALSGPNKGLREGLQINDLTLQRTLIVDQIAGIDPSIRVANNTSTENFLAAGIRISADLEARAQVARDAGQIDAADNLTRQAEIFRNRPIEVDAVRTQIADIDAQVTKRGVLMTDAEVADLQQKRAVLVADLEVLTRDLSSVDSMRQQNEALVKTVKENLAFAEYEALVKQDAQKADLVARYAPENAEIVKYRTELESNADLSRLETDANRRLLSIAALQDNLSKITDLESQKRTLLNDIGAESSESVSRAIDNLDAEISRLNEQGVLDVDQTIKLEDLQTQRLDLQAELNKLNALDDEIGGIRKITDAASAENRSVWQRVVDFFSPSKTTRNAYYESLALTREAEAIKAKLAGLGVDSDDARTLREQLADVNRRLLDQQAILADARANPSKGIFRTIADFFSSRAERGEVADLKSLAKVIVEKNGTRSLDIAEQMSAKQAEINKLNDEDPIANAAKIKDLENQIIELRKTAQSILRGADALIKVDQSEAGQDKKYTRYVLTDAGEKAGLKNEQLNVLNDELAKFEQYRRDGQTAKEIVDNGLFKIYSNTGSFKDQDVFLLAEIEALGAGRRGTVFGALPGMGKTDVVMPFNVLLKQRLTNASQFVVFPEAKLMKPWTSDASYTPNKDFLNYVESRFGPGSVVIIKAGDQGIDPSVIAKAKFIITTKDVAFDLQNTETRLGLNLRDKWRKSYVHADEVDWTFNPNENYKLSGQQVALRDKPEFNLYLEAQKQVLGVDENGSLIPGRGLSTLGALVNELGFSKSIPDGIIRTSDGKGGKFSNADLEKQVLGEWLGSWGGQSRIPGLDMSADPAVVRLQINDYLTRSADADVHQHRAELAMINETVNFLSRVPGEDYGLATNTRNNGGVEEIINSIAPREQGRTSGRSYSAVAESLLYNTLGARILGANGDVDVTRLTVGENGSEINYALLMLESQGFSLYTGTPETVAKLYKMAYGIDLKVFTDSAVDDSLARFNAPPAGTDSQIFSSLRDQVVARLGDNRNQVFINMASGLRSNEAALNDLVRTVGDTGAPYQKILLVGANGELVEYQITGTSLVRVESFATTDALNVRTTALDGSGERYIKFYEYGAHVGVDTANNVELSRAVGLCSGCDQTTFSQGINRVRVKVIANGDGTSTVKYAPIDIVHLDAAGGVASLKNFTDAMSERQVINEALAEVSFKETLLKNSVDGTFAELIDLARNGKDGFLGFGSYKTNLDVVAQLEAAQQKWKETTGMNYLLGSDDMTAQAKLEKTASQVSAAYDELTRLLAGSGEPAKLLAKRADGAVGDNPIKLAFSGDEGYQVLGETPSYRQIVDLINQSSKHLESVKIAFTNKSSPAEVVQSELARVADEAQANVNPVRDVGDPAGGAAPVRDDGPDGTVAPDGGVVRNPATAPVGGNAIVPVADNSVANDPIVVAPVVDDGVTRPDAGGPDAVVSDGGGAGLVRPTDNNTADNSNTTRTIGFATFVSNLWSGSVNEDQLLAENASVVEANKQVILDDYQAQIDGLTDQLATATESEVIDSITSQIADLELAKTDEETLDLAAKAMTTDQLANDYRVGGIRNLFSVFSGRAGERAGGITVSANSLSGVVEFFVNGFNEQLFVADNEAEINAAANAMQEAATAVKVAEMEALAGELEKLNNELQTITDSVRQQEILSQMEGLAGRVDEIEAEFYSPIQPDFTVAATNQVREKYTKDQKYQTISPARRLAAALLDRYNFKKAVDSFQAAYNSSPNQDSRAYRFGNSVASFFKSFSLKPGDATKAKFNLLTWIKDGYKKPAAATEDGWGARVGRNLAKQATKLFGSVFVSAKDPAVQERMASKNISPEEFLKNKVTPFNVQEEILVLRKTKPNSWERNVLKILFRERYATQLKGIAALRQELEQVIMDNPNISFVDFKGILGKYQKDYALLKSDDSTDFTLEDDLEVAYGKYQEHKKKVAQIKNEYELDKVALLENLFSKKATKPFSVIFNADNIVIELSKDDYENIIGKSSGGIFLHKKEMKQKASTDKAVAVNGIFTVVNIDSNDDVAASKKHERQHLLHMVFYGLDELKTFDDIEKWAADEVLAYFEGGDWKENLIKIVLEANLDGTPKTNYDFFKWASIEDLALKNAYNKHLYAAIDAYSKLLELGFSHPEIRAMFEGQVITKWPKLANRLANTYADDGYQGKSIKPTKSLAVFLYRRASNNLKNRFATVLANRTNLKKAVEAVKIISDNSSNQDSRVFRLGRSLTNFFQQFNPKNYDKKLSFNIVAWVKDGWKMPSSTTATSPTTTAPTATTTWSRISTNLAAGWSRVRNLRVASAVSTFITNRLNFAQAGTRIATWFRDGYTFSSNTNSTTNGNDRLYQLGRSISNFVAQFIPQRANSEDDGTKTTVFRNVDSVSLSANRVLSIDQIKALKPIEATEITYSRDNIPAKYPDRNSISRGNHAKVSIDANTGLLSVIDQNSTNGTFINGFRVAANTPYLLRDGNRVGIGIAPSGASNKNAIELVVRVDDAGNYYLVDMNNFFKPQLFVANKVDQDQTLFVDKTEFEELPSSQTTKNITYSTEVIGRNTVKSITDGKVSREHLLVYHGNDGSLFVEDNNSANGSFVRKYGSTDRTRINKGEAINLQAGDSVFLDSYELRVVYDKNRKAFVLVNTSNKLVQGMFVDAYESASQKAPEVSANALSNDMREHLNYWGGLGTIAEKLITQFSYYKTNQIWLYGPGKQKGRRTSVTTAGGEDLGLQYKLHFAVTAADFDGAIEEMTAYLRTLGVLHKIAPGKLIVTDTGSKQFGKAITIYAQDPAIAQLIALKSTELGKKYQGIKADEMARVGANLNYETEVPGTNGLLYYTLENVSKNQFGSDKNDYYLGGKGGVYIDNVYYEGYAARKKIMDMFWGKGPLDNWIDTTAAAIVQKEKNAKLKNLFTALGTPAPVIDTARDYQTQLSALIKLFKEIQDLETRSGLKYFTYNAGTATDFSEVQIRRVNTSKFVDLADFRAKAKQVISTLNNSASKSLAKPTITKEDLVLLINELGVVDQYDLSQFDNQSESYLFINYCALLEKAGRISEANNLFKEFINLNPEFNAVNYSYILFEMRNFEALGLSTEEMNADIEKRFKSIVNSNQKDQYEPIYLLAYANFLQAASRSSEALELYEQALDLIEESSSPQNFVNLDELRQIISSLSNQAGTISVLPFNPDNFVAEMADFVGRFSSEEVINAIDKYGKAELIMLRARGNIQTTLNQSLQDQINVAKLEFIANAAEQRLNEFRQSFISRVAALHGEIVNIFGMRIPHFRSLEELNLDPETGNLLVEAEYLDGYKNELIAQWQNVATHFGITGYESVEAFSSSEKILNLASAVAEKLGKSQISGREVINAFNSQHEYLSGILSLEEQSIFENLCSDCSLVREETKQGVELADNLLSEANLLIKQAQEARTAGNQKQAVDLDKQAQAKKQAALNQLSQTRNQVVNDHGMQNQCVQLYLNAWVDVREAVLRQTLVDTNSAVRAVYNATNLIRQTLSNGFMEVREIGLLGLVTPVQNIPLDAQAISDFTQMGENLKQWAEFKEDAGLLTEELVAGELKTLRDQQVKNNGQEYIVDTLRVGIKELYKEIKTNLISDDAAEQLELFLSEVQPVLSAFEVDGTLSSISLAELNTNLTRIMDGIQFLQNSNFDQTNIFEKIVAFGETLQKRSDYLARLKTKVESLSDEYAGLIEEPYITGDLTGFSAAKLIMQADKISNLIKAKNQEISGITPVVIAPSKAPVVNNANSFKPAETMGRIWEGIKRNAVAATATAGVAATGIYLWAKRVAAKRLAKKLVIPKLNIPKINISKPKFNFRAAWTRFRINAAMRMPRISKPRNIVAAVLSAAVIASIVYFSVVPQGTNVAPVDNKPAIVQTVEAPQVQAPVVQAPEVQVPAVVPPASNVVPQQSGLSDQEIKAIKQQMDQILDEAPGEWGAYVHKIGTPANEGYTYDNNKSFHAASTIKVPVAMAVMHYFESQNIPLEQALNVAPKGQDRIIRQLLKAMLVESEEEATAILADFVRTSTDQNINVSFEEMGMDGILYGKENADGYMRSTSPEAMGAVLEALYTGKSGLSKENTDYILDLMKTQSKDDEYRIGAGLPLDVQVNMAHKVGTVLGDGVFTVSDVAIVTLENGDAYVITVYSTLQNKEQYPESPAVITEISKLAFQMYSSENPTAKEEVSVVNVPVGSDLQASNNTKSSIVPFHFTEDSKSIENKDRDNFQSAFTAMAPFYSHLQADELRIKKKAPGKIKGGKDYYALAYNEVLDNGNWLGYIEFTSDYSTNGHLNKTLSNLGLSDKIEEAALIHEIGHLIKYEKDSNGKYVKSSFLSAFDNIFYGDAAGSKELPPTDYANDYYVYKDASTEEHDRAVTEDLADSITLYLIAPEYLKQVAPLRYEFIDAIAHGVDPNLFQGAPTNADAFSFNDLCSDCTAVREATKNGVQIADGLMAEVKTLNDQAEAAKTAGDQNKAADLTKQAAAKQKAAIKQLNDTRNQVVNAHGMQNQCVQLYLNAWVNTREALIRKTRADVDNAIDSVFKATVLAEGMLDSKQMSVREGGFFGIGADIKYKDLTTGEIDDVADLLFGNEDKGIEGLQSFAVFVKEGTVVTRTIIGGSLVDIENSVVSDSLSSIRVFLRNFAISSKQRFFFDEQKEKIAALSILLSEKIKPDVSISITPSVTKPSVSVTPSITKSPTPSITPTPTLTPAEKAAEAAFWRKLWTILGSVFGVTVIGSTIYWNLPSFNNPPAPPQHPPQIVEEKKAEPTVSASPTVTPEPTITEVPVQEEDNGFYIDDDFVPQSKDEKLIVLLADALNEWQDSGSIEDGVKASDALKEKLKDTEFAYLLDDPDFITSMRRVDDIYTTFQNSNPNQEVQCVTFAVLLSGSGVNADSIYNLIGIDGVKGGATLAKQFVSAELATDYDGVYNNGEYMEYRVSDLSVFQPGDYGIVNNKGSGNPGHIFYVISVNKDADGNVISIVTADANYGFEDGSVNPDGNVRISVLTPSEFETKYGTLSSSGIASQITAIRGYENPNAVKVDVDSLSISLPTGQDVETVAVLDTALPDRYNVSNPYAEYKFKPDGTIVFTSSDEWNPIDTSILPEFTTSRTADDYLSTIELFNVEQSKRYRRDSSNTYCNIYVSDVTNALGVYIPRWVNGSKLNAKTMIDWLEAPLAEDLGWREVTPEEAQQLANQGIPTVAATPGHIAMVIPGEGETKNGTYYPASAQAGSKNFDDGKSTNYGFAGAIERGQEIQYFANASQYELVQPGSNQ